MKFFKWMWNSLKAAGRGIVRACKAVGRGVGKVLGAGADAVTASAVPLYVIKGDSSLSHEAKAVAAKMFTEKTRVAVGARAKVIAGKAAGIASKLKFIKIAGTFTKIATAGSAAVGTTILGGLLVVGFVGLIWFAKRIAKRLSGEKPWEAVEKAEKGETVIEMVEQLAA